MAGLTIADVYTSGTIVSAGGANRGAANVVEAGQPVSRLSLLAWLALVGALIVGRVLWEMSE